MSTGTLRGLAARALGLATPLRSQRARGFDGLSADSAAGGEPTPLPTTPQTAPWMAPLAPVVGETRAITDAPEAALDPPALESRIAATADAVRRRADAPTQGRDRLNLLAGPLSRHPSPAPLRAQVITQDITALAPARREHPASPGSTNVAAPAARTFHVEVPAPLLPLSALARLPPAAAHVSTPIRRGQPSGTAAAEAPTEVHVSIGRVELTALAPTTAARTLARRETPAGRSLADYLRGTGGKRPT